MEIYPNWTALPTFPSAPNIHHVQMPATFTKLQFFRHFAQEQLQIFRCVLPQK